MNNWLFQSNPKYYEIDKAIRELKTIVWKVSSYQKEIKPGDPVFIWKSGADGGILALGEIMDNPHEMPTPEAEKKYLTERGQGMTAGKFSATVQIKKLVEPILSKDKITNNLALANLSVLRFANASNFRVTEEQALEINKMIEGESNLDRVKRYLSLFKGQAANWFQERPFIKEYAEYFRIFFNEKTLSQATWDKFQKMGDHLHAFNSMPLAKKKALGNPNHPIEHYRNAFIYLLYGKSDPLETRLKNFVKDPKYKLEFFGWSVCSEIFGHAFPEKFTFLNKRNEFASRFLGVPFEKRRGEDFVDSFLRYNKALKLIIEQYGQIVGKQTELPLNYEIDQFLCFLYEHFSGGGDSEAEILEKTESFDETRRYWIGAPGNNGVLWDEFVKEGIFAIGWDYLGDLRKYQVQEDIEDKLKEHEKENRDFPNASKACFDIAYSMKEGDVIFAKKGIKVILGYGVVQSDYEYKAGRASMKNVRNVKWYPCDTVVEIGTQKLPVKTLTDITSYGTFVQTLKDLVNFDPTLDQEDSSKIEISEPAQSYSPGPTLWSDVFMGADEYQKALDLLKIKNNLLLQGPPGTGKTFLARKLAESLTNGNRAQTEIAQFHQSYSYEDFVQGYRPGESNQFQRKDGLFLYFCKKAKANKTTNYVFIADEINRANVSRVFGELMMLLERDKRNDRYAAKLAYSQDGEDKFFVPPNVFLIGTMNTADRSLALVDYAFRRRFAIFDVNPRFESPVFRKELETVGVEGTVIDTILDRFPKLNKEIGADTRGLGPGFEIGHSYFCPSDPGQYGMDWYRSVIQYEIAPLLREYWFDRPETADQKIQQLLA